MAKRKLESVVSNWIDRWETQLDTPFRRWEIFVFGAILVFCSLNFNHGDLRNALESCLALYRGHFRDFYEYTNITMDRETLHFPPKYWVLTLWNAPLYIVGLLRVPADCAKVLMWSKVLLLIVGGLCALELKKVFEALQYGADAKRGVIWWITSPFVLFTVCIYGTYDVFYTYLCLIGLRLLLEEKFWKSALFWGLAGAFKGIALIFFIPLLVLLQKRVAIVGVAAFIALLPTKLVKMLYLHSNYFKENVLNWDHIDRIFWMFVPRHASGETFFGGALSLFFFAWFIILGCCYFEQVQNIAEKRQKITRVFTAVAASFTIFVFWHPHWLIIITPLFALLAMEMSSRQDYFRLSALEIGGFIAFSAMIFMIWGGFDRFFTNFSIFPFLKDVLWAGEYEANLFYMRFLPFRGNRALQFYYSMLCAMMVLLLVLSFRARKAKGVGEKESFPYLLVRVRVASLVAFIGPLLRGQL